MASVLVVAADPNIESLIGQLLEVAGHRPVYDATMGSAGEAIRRERPEVALLDISLPASVVRACLDATDEVGCEPVLTSSTFSPSELAHGAEAGEYLHFALPGRPDALRRVIDRALERRRTTPLRGIDSAHLPHAGGAGLAQPGAE